MKITVKAAEHGQRIDIFLAENLKDTTRSQLQKQIKQGGFTVNGQTVSSNHRLKEGDVIETAKVKTVKKAEKDATLEIKSKPVPKITIIAETPDYLVINKPCGLIVHGDNHIKETTLTDILLKKYPEIKNVGDDPLRPGIVHRLDKDVSGLMVVARTQEFFNHIKEQFQSRTTSKKYTGLIFGKIAKDEIIIDFPIERSASGHKMAAKPTSQGGKEAISEVKVLERRINHTLVKVKIITGRTHQVRAHLAAYGTPLVGDNIYGTRTTKDRNKKMKTERVFLVADELSFDDLQGERQSFKIDLPNDFKEMLEKAK